MSSCGVCVKTITSKQLKISCIDCALAYHAACQGMSKADVECIANEELPWRCKKCATERRKSMRMDAEANEGKVTLHDLMTCINEIKENQLKTEKEFNKSFESLNEQLEKNTKALDEATDKNEKYLQLINDLLIENKTLKNKLQALEDQCDDMEQYSRVNCVEIHGVPMVKNEDVLLVVKEVGKALDVTITDSMVDACHRLPSRSGGTGPPSIIVKLVRRLDKEEILRKRRVKRTLSTRHMGLTVDQPIFINESMTRRKRELFNAARRVKREKDYAFLWTRNGKIFLRKKENSPVVVITSKTDFNKL